ncbi:MAG: AP endonuclease [Bacteroidota bacterium]
MKKVPLTFLLLLFFYGIKAQSNFDRKNLLAWCVVPFDQLKRSPEARMDMFNRLGIHQYAYDWRNEHITTFAEEIDLARKNEIAIEGIWLWIDNKNDKIGSLSVDNEKIIEIANSKKLQTTYWIGFNYNFFEGLTHFEKVKKGADFLQYLEPKLKKVDSKIALYNHGDWFGEPENQIEIIKASGLKNIGIVYSFHHGHHQINRFHSMFVTIKPYLVAVNLNGMDLKKGQILTIGEGKSEQEMIEIIKKAGYKGRIGVLGHIMEEDVELVLQRNMEGLAQILK